MRARVAFLVTHLSGTGHFVRIATLARAVAAAGATVRVISGGRALPHVGTGDLDVVALPALQVAGRDFANPLDAEGRPADAAYLAARAGAAAAATAAFAPDLLVTETFPLGRRRLAGEFEAAIDAARAARPGARIAASLRDLPEPPSKPKRLAEAVARLGAYDLAIVHGDAGFLPLDHAWPLPPPAAALVRHAGYVAAPPPLPVPSDEVLVGVGGGDLGRALLAVAAAAAARSRHPWRLRTGGPDAAALAARLAAAHGGGLIAEPPAPDWRARLAGARAAVTLAGYNTVTDLAACDTPAVLVADTTGGEREQAMRAAALAGRPGFDVLDSVPDPDRLARLVDGLAAGPRRPPLPIRLDGAARAAALILDLARSAP
ncbi:MAG: glycosyltransferase [Pseudomonadota bacterium]